MLTSNKKSLPLIVFSLVLVTGATSLLEGCGFRLRGAITLPESLASISIEGTTEHTELGRVLYRSFKRGDVTVVSPGEATLRLQILRDEVVRRVLSVDASGKANEYELKHLLRYTVTDNEDKIIVPTQDISTVRAYKFDPNALLAKGDEELQLRKGMIISSAQQMLRQLTAALRQQAATLPAPKNSDLTPADSNPATK